MGPRGFSVDPRVYTQSYHISYMYVKHTVGAAPLNLWGALQSYFATCNPEKYFRLQFSPVVTSVEDFVSIQISIASEKRHFLLWQVAVMPHPHCPTKTHGPPNDF